MNGEMQLSNDRIIDHALPSGYIVIAPTSPYSGLDGNPSWLLVYHRAQLSDILKKSAGSDPRIDPKRIHFTGFNQEGFMTWDILCHASDVVCSVAPLAASGRDDWGADVGYGDQCFMDGVAPAVHRSIMLTIGTSDPLSSAVLSRAQVDSVAAAYYEESYLPQQTSTSGLTLQAYGPTASDINVHFYEHSSACNLYYRCGGHCFPADPARGGCEASLWGGNFGSGQEGLLYDHRCCVHDFDYGAKVLEFFQQNPCDSSIAPTSSPPTSSPPTKLLLNGCAFSKPTLTFNCRCCGIFRLKPNY